MDFKICLFLLLSVFAVTFAASTSGEEAVLNVIEEVTTAKPHPGDDQGTYTQRAKLMKDLFTEYDSNVNPDNLKVEFGVTLISMDVCEEKNLIEADVWYMMKWTDHRLAWNVEETGVGILRIPNNLVWKPDIKLYNSANHGTADCSETHTVVYPNGNVLWIPPCHLSALCSVETMRLTEFPYGEHECFLKFGSWVYDGYKLDLQFYKNESALLLDHYWNSTEWNVVKSSAERINKFYSCCKEPYPNLTYNITIQRKSPYSCSHDH